MAEKRPIIHPFFLMKKRKETKTTESEGITDSSPSNDERMDEVDVQSGAAITVDDDQSDEELSSSTVNNQPNKHLSRCELICCSSSTMYAPASESEYESTTTQDKRSCQESWFKTFTWLTFCKVYYCSWDDSACLFSFFRKFRQRKKYTVSIVEPQLIKIFIEKLIYLRIYRFPLKDSATGKMLYVDFVCMKVADFIPNVYMQFSSNQNYRSQLKLILLQRSNRNNDDDYLWPRFHH